MTMDVTWLVLLLIEHADHRLNRALQAAFRQLNLLPKAFVGIFYDDCLVVADSQDEQQRSVSESDRFDVLTGQKIGHKKTVGFTIPCTEPVLRSRGQLLKQVTVDKLLGVLIRMDNQPDQSLQDKRALEAQAEIHPIAKLPVPLEEKATLLALKTAGARYGLELEEPTARVARDFDQCVLQTLCGQRALRCKYTSMGLAWRGHRLFIEMAIPYQAFDMARRQLLRLPFPVELVREVWEYRGGCCLKGLGSRVASRLGPPLSLALCGLVSTGSLVALCSLRLGGRSGLTGGVIFKLSCGVIAGMEPPWPGALGVVVSRSRRGTTSAGSARTFPTVVLEYHSILSGADLDGQVVKEIVPRNWCCNIWLVYAVWSWSDMEPTSLTRVTQMLSSETGAGALSSPVGALMVVDAHPLPSVLPFERDSGAPPLLYGTVPLVPKSESGLPEEQHPLTYLSVWAVGFDKATYNLSKDWLKALMPGEMRGARPDAMTLDITWAITLLLEHSHCFQQFKAGYLLDREQCFDRLPWSITYELEASVGYPVAWTAADRRFNKELLTAFRLGPSGWAILGLHKRFQARSCFQRAPCCTANGSLGLTQPFIGNFYDDCLVVANTEAERQLSMDESHKFDELTGQLLGHKNTVGFVVPSGVAVAPLTSRGTPLKQVAAEKFAWCPCSY
ncbi:unnamed protein product [Symbiodinium sp. CCMP2592]|nr:unnamed protein product [Symbiodinium sp. CCMP2592]